jgi:hypothetical protein
VSSKRTKGKARPDKSRIAAQRRAERNLYPSDFEVKLPVASVEVLAKITPMPPKWMLEESRLTASPAQTWLGLQDHQLDGAAELIARWPFRIANPGKKAGSWVCLALLAHEQAMEITDFARYQCELEDEGLIVWSNEHNVYVLAHDLSGTPEEKIQKIDQIWDDWSRESADERAQRRWHRPQVVAEPADGE